MKTIVFPNQRNEKQSISTNNTIYNPSIQNTMLYQLYLD